MKSFWSDFKEFLMRGSVLDLAVGVVIGAAFTAIVNSLVNDIIMPVVSIFIGKDSFKSLTVTINNAVIPYGNFIQAVVNFLIIAFVVFLFLRVLVKAQSLRKKKEEAVEEQHEETQEKLLAEIRDLLAKQSK
ncbi:large conductance mechanosensitive channel protein MscL [Culicoidibacter larvae]|uniref:Large-conductance mechanosensitive channel n=1 Tax=Culicoidibacter larvae TaxID=2579976 RepID=A0A5R8QDC6_9FIRM|nr:large conductance mechanosensitive channel protein MscL [Culicoidibacter larvae]TLG74344.1 large conductance mechanosensitive channel protein MscL [Culicoidibacter larvae]